MAWYHRLFTECGEKSFLEEIRDRKAIVLGVSDYFAGKWSNAVPKPFTHVEKHLKKYGIKDKEDEAIR